jgi:hypothetical protein
MNSSNPVGMGGANLLRRTWAGNIKDAAFENQKHNKQQL